MDCEEILSSLERFLDEEVEFCDMAVNNFKHRDPRNLLEWMEGRRAGNIIVRNKLRQLSGAPYCTVLMGD